MEDILQYIIPRKTVSYMDNNKSSLNDLIKAITLVGQSQNISLQKKIVVFDNYWVSNSKYFDVWWMVDGISDILFVSSKPARTWESFRTYRIFDHPKGLISHRINITVFY